MDERFRIETLRATNNPQQLSWQAMHQDYSTDYIVNTKAPSERKSGELIVKHLLSGGRGHYGPLEHPQITVACGYFPHSVMQQLRTHRVGITFDCQSFRYTGNKIVQAAENKIDIEEVFYIRPVGNYGNFNYDEKSRKQDLERCLNTAKYYHDCITLGMSKEQARGLLPFDYRQHFIMSLNARSLMHLLDLRSKSDAQLECQWFSELLFQQFQEWMPEVAQWYLSNRFSKAKLSP